jgi:hypothetical protein
MTTEKLHKRYSRLEKNILDTAKCMGAFHQSLSTAPPSHIELMTSKGINRQLYKVNGLSDPSSTLPHENPQPIEMVNVQGPLYTSTSTGVATSNSATFAVPTRDNWGFDIDMSQCKAFDFALCYPGIEIQDPQAWSLLSPLSADGTDNSSLLVTPLENDAFFDRGLNANPMGMQAIPDASEYITRRGIFAQSLSLI